MAAYIRTFVSTVAQRWNLSLNSLRLIIQLWSREGPPPGLAIVGCPSISPTHQPPCQSSAKSTLDSIFDGILLAVPKHRRSLEKRLFRKHRFTGFMEYGTPKTNIVPCLECGNFKEKGHLCKHCYERVREETKEMQAKMGDDLEFNVPRKEMEFVYEGENISSDGKYVVKMDKARPSWFPRHLLNKTGS